MEGQDPRRILRMVLEQERRRGYPDSTVSGGLDRMLRGLFEAGAIKAGSSVHDIVLETLSYPYRQLSPAMRERWVEKTLTTLSRPERARPTRPAALAELEPPAAIRMGITEPRPKRKREQGTGSREQAKRTRPAARAGADAGAAAPKSPPTKVVKVKGEGGLALDSSIRELPYAARSAAKLEALGVATVRDLLFYLPHRYDDFSQIQKVNELRPGTDVTVIVQVFSLRETGFGPTRRGAEAMVTDGTGMLRVVWFNQPWLVKQLSGGMKIVLSGKVGVFRDFIQMDSPDWEPVEGSDLSASIQAGRLAPVYPLTQGLSLRSVRRLVRAALDRCLTLIEETLPAELREARDLLPLREAIAQAHYPDSQVMAERARTRLAYDELLTLQVAILRRRQERQVEAVAPALAPPDGLIERFAASLPFALTGAQARVIGEVTGDLGRATPMARLLQGDVGSGKTVIAAAALLAAVAQGYQGSLMAPTEILAEQHFRTICRLLDGESLDGATALCRPPYLDRPVQIALLRGGLGAKSKARAQAAITTGAVDIAIGTQALIQEAVQMPRLALAVVDEQHRFGVLQRTALREKGVAPLAAKQAAHLLVMTATPIPRTLALTMYGDLDVSVLDAMPPGRKPIRTTVVESGERNQAYNFIYEQIRDGRQAFIICPLVEESETLEVRAATAEFERLRAEVFPQLSLALLHGRMSAREKDETMAAFRDHLVDVLVSTAVVEVGIDVPNANLIMIEGAERFGLAQLHQFRGRVGRGETQSYCLLLSDSASAEARERLLLMEQHADGFKLAEEDLRLRGEGDVFGTRQSGLPALKIARLTDTLLLEAARDDAAAVLSADGALSDPAHAQIAAAVGRFAAGGGQVN